MIVSHVTREDWKGMSADAHLTVFKEILDPEIERIDFALLAADVNNTLILYCTFKELDAESVYMNFGGSFPPYRGSPDSFQAFRAFISWCAARYKNLIFHVVNTNTAMLKMALKVEAKIVGVSLGKAGSILVEHLLELKLGI